MTLAAATLSLPHRLQCSLNAALDGCPQLLEAAKEGDVPLATLLLQRFANVNSTDEAGRAALHRALLTHPNRVTDPSKADLFFVPPTNTEVPGVTFTSHDAGAYVVKVPFSTAERVSRSSTWQALSRFCRGPPEPRTVQSAA